jgi:hypothetical protein
MRQNKPVERIWKSVSTDLTLRNRRIVLNTRKARNQYIALNTAKNTVGIATDYLTEPRRNNMRLTVTAGTVNQVGNTSLRSHTK